MCVCVCVCVCERERERYRKGVCMREKERKCVSVQGGPIALAHIYNSGVSGEKGKETSSASIIMHIHCSSLPRHTAIKHRGGLYIYIYIYIYISEAENKLGMIEGARRG